jgi:hypothetical protein
MFALRILLLVSKALLEFYLYQKLMGFFILIASFILFSIGGSTCIPSSVCKASCGL